MLSIQRIFREEASDFYEFCVRDFRYLNFYELRLNEYPYLFLKGKIDIQANAQMICHSMMNYRYIVSYACNGEMQRYQDILILNRLTNEESNIKRLCDDKIFIVNQKFDSEKIPLLIKFSE